MAKSAYIHIPFCRHKCHFCDFVAHAGIDDLIDEYCRIVVREIEERLFEDPNDQKLKTVYFGGGTPGYLEPRLLLPILSALEANCGIECGAEITLETTPGCLSLSRCREWLASGFNRISIGVESMDDGELEAIGRGADRAGAVAGLQIARQSGFSNIAVDLIYGLPGQNQLSWQQSLTDLLALKPEHLSAYNLTIAAGAKLLRKYPRGSPCYPDEKAFEDMYYLAVECCAKQGLKQYEIANFALDGFECRHNLTYWQNSEYLAFGAGAHRYFRGRRSANWRSVKKYMREYKSLESHEEIDAATRAQEAIFLGLRLRQGIDLSKLQAEYGIDLLESRAEKIEELSGSGFLELAAGRLRLTHKGVLVSNTVLAELI
jgi:oxygen-independent coproporphyrinogen III oxidase